MIFKEETKSIPITKEMVWAAYKKIRQNGEGSGVDSLTQLGLGVSRSNNFRQI